MDSSYEEFLKKHDLRLERMTKADFKQYGKAIALCHGYCNETEFGDFASCRVEDKAYLIRWIKENGFRQSISYNSHGTPSIVWYL